MKPNIFLKVTSAILVDGDIIKPGRLIEVTDSEAKGLLARGKCVLATEEDGLEVDAVSAGTDPELHDDIAAHNAAVIAAAEEAAAEQARKESDEAKAGKHAAGKAGKNNHKS